MIRLELTAQACLNMYTGADTSIACNISCFELRRRIPDIRSSEDYKVISIPYQPFAYTTNWGQDLGYLYQDDKYSDTLDFSFPFCFYGQIYSRSVVGSNGLITFDVPTNALKNNSWRLRISGVPVPIPYAGGLPNSANSVYYPRAAIMATYQDLNPAISPSDRKIEARTEGVYPCRKFIVSFYNLAHFGNPAAINTYQIVMHEGTGVFDIFIATKPDPGTTGTNAGVSILGIQNWQRDSHVAVPGRNCTNWSATNEGWRFVPNGSSSLLSRVELYKDGNIVSVGSTTSLGNGELDVLFPGICQSEANAVYVVKAFYKRCDDPLVETEAYDTVVVSRSGIPDVQTSISPPFCSGGNGMIVVTSPSGPGNEYSIDNGNTWQSSNQFSVPAGTYSVQVRNTSTGCLGIATVTVSPAIPATLNATVNGLKCYQDRSGQIHINPSGGNPPWQFSIDSGNTYQNSGVFSNLPAGTYTLRIKDAAGCTADTMVTLTQPTPLLASAQVTAASCIGTDGTLLIHAMGGTPGYSYSLDGGLHYQSAGLFQVTPGDYHFIWVKDNNQCLATLSATIPLIDNMFLYAGNDTTICEGDRLVLHPLTNTGATVFQWQPATWLNRTDIKNPVARPTSDINYFLTVNYGICSRTDSIKITVLSKPHADAGRDTTAIPGLPHPLFGAGVGSYQWSPSALLNNPTLVNPVAILLADTYFTLRITGDNGCTDSDDVWIRVLKGPAYYIPTAFTPNGDGLNDRLRPVAVGIRRTDYFRIFNRYGQLVFQDKGDSPGWDGTISGIKQDPGTYVWMIRGFDMNNKMILLKGQVTLIR